MVETVIEVETRTSQYVRMTSTNTLVASDAQSALMFVGAPIRTP
jgi:hypothetical protein